MFDLITLAQMRQHDPYGFMNEECGECNEDFNRESKIYNKQESNLYLCQRCYDEVSYTSSVQIPT